MVNTKSNASKSLFNTTLTSSPSGKRIANKTIDFSTNQYQMFEANKPNKYSNLKPKLQGRGPGSPTAKYTSPYAQPKKKKIVKKQSKLIKQDSNMQVAAELFASIV